MRRAQRPPRAHRALLRKLLSGSVVGRTILGDVEEEHQARFLRDGQRAADAWYRSQARRLCLRDLRLRLTTSSAWRRRRRSGTPESRGRTTLWLTPFASLWQDARYALRSVAVYRGRSLAAVAMLALAIGIATAMFTVADALLLRPVPFPDADRLARLTMRDDRGNALISVPPEVFHAWRASTAFEAVEGARSTFAWVGFDGGEVNRVVARVTPGLFAMLGGVQPLRGRLFGPADGQPDRDDQVLVSENLWRSLYAADPSLVGRTVRIDDRPATVVGILPAEFRFPDASTVIWRLDAFDRPDDRPPIVYARFARDVPRDDALALATAQAHDAGAYADTRANATPLQFDYGDYRDGVIQMLAGAVLLLFVVLCANVAGLLLGNLTSRVHEFSTRTALGAPRGRLMRQAFLEAAMLGAGGSAAGAALAWLIVSAGHTILPPATLGGSLNTLDIDLRALSAAAIAGVAATLGAGLIPAISGTRTGVSRLLQTSGHSSPMRGARAATRALLVCQVALSCTLVFGATLLVRSFINLAGQDRGLDVSNVLAANVGFPAESFTTPEARLSAASSLRDAARALPGMTTLSWSHGRPPRGNTYGGLWTSDAAGAEPVDMIVHVFGVEPDFFDLYRVPILRGRPFRASDHVGDSWWDLPDTAVLVSEHFASTLWPGQDPLGRRFTFGESPELRVIGLVRDLYLPSLDDATDVPEIYVPFGEPGVFAVLSMRCGGPCPDPNQVREQLKAAHPGGRLLNEVAPPESGYLAHLSNPRAAATLGSSFALIALVAAAAGLFCLFSQSVARRRRELGVRTALGATPAHLRRLVWSEGLIVTLLGIAIAAIASVALTRLLSSMLLDVAPTDPLSWAIVVITLVAAIAAAAWYPTKTAVRASPVALLRED